MRRRHFLLALPFALLAGCTWLGHGTNDPAHPYVGWKQVMRKVPPVYLVATDRTQCTVTDEKYRKVKEGDVVFCTWSAAAMARTGGDGWRTDRTGPPGRSAPRSATGGDGPAPPTVGGTPAAVVTGGH